MLSRRRPRALRAPPRLPRRRAAPRPRLAHPGRQAGARSSRRRMVSFEQRHLAVMTFEVTLLDGDAPVAISSQLLNRQDGEDEYYVRPRRPGRGSTRARPRVRRAGAACRRATDAASDRISLGYRCANSGMTLARRRSTTTIETAGRPRGRAAHADGRPRQDGLSGSRRRQGSRSGSTKVVDLPHLARRAGRASSTTAATAPSTGWPATRRREHSATSSASGSTLLGGGRRRGRRRRPERPAGGALEPLPARPGHAAARSRPGIAGQGGDRLAATRATTSGTPRPTCCPSSPTPSPSWPGTRCASATGCCRPRGRGPASWPRPARSSRGAPSTARRPRPTTPPARAQYHINADVVFALMQYVDGHRGRRVPGREGVDMLVETARMWSDLGFWRDQRRGPDVPHPRGHRPGRVHDRGQQQPLHQRHGQRTTSPGGALGHAPLARRVTPTRYDELVDRLDLDDDEVDEWARCAEGMYIPFDEGLRHAPAGRALPRAGGRGTSPARPPRSAR